MIFIKLAEYIEDWYYPEYGKLTIFKKNVIAYLKYQKIPFSVYDKETNQYFDKPEASKADIYFQSYYLPKVNRYINKYIYKSLTKS